MNVRRANGCGRGNGGGANAAGGAMLAAACEGAQMCSNILRGQGCSYGDKYAPCACERFVPRRSDPC